MVITRLVGGLGNQMFQYAAGYSLARRTNSTLLLDLSWYAEKNSSVWVMDYALDCFALSPHKVDPTQYKVVDRIRGVDRLRTRTVKEFKEKGLPYDEQIWDAGDRVVLDGYWQSEKYFAAYRSELLKEFTFTAPISRACEKLEEQITSCESVSLHVRRGDYASHAQTNATHGLMPLGYYIDAVESIQKRHKDITVFVFSDDPDWCSENIKIKAPVTYVSGNKGFEDMKLMSLCRHNVIANSSFSWWGAWLNTNAHKIVIAPKKWFADKGLDSRDIVPDSWERI